MHMCECLKCSMVEKRKELYSYSLIQFYAISKESTSAQVTVERIINPKWQQTRHKIKSFIHDTYENSTVHRIRGGWIQKSV